HYVNFLMAHGMAPYRDIIDINMPGSYFIEGWAMHIFGGGDLGWRFYDFTLLAILTASMIVISLPFDWFAGLCAGVLFTLIHAMEGPRNAGQREQVMITLIMVGYGLLFSAMRRQKPLLMLPFGFTLGLAASLKPTAAPLGLVLLLIISLALRKKVVSTKPYVGYGLLGIFLASLLSLQFLFKYHVFGDFVSTARGLIPYYASVGNAPFWALVRDLLHLRTAVPLVIGIVLAFFNRQRTEWENWERLALILGILFGAFSYIAQGKLFDHHAYAFKAFVALWVVLECTKAMRTKGWRHIAGLAVIGFGILVVAPKYVRVLATVDPLSELPDALKADIVRLGGSTLQNQVQCLDMVDGCFSTLYHLGLLPNTTFMSDYMLLGPVGSPPLTHYRDLFWNDIHKNPPKVIVLTKMWLSEGQSFQKLDQWPELADYLNSAYSLDVTRSFQDRGYRIYVLKNEKPSPSPRSSQTPT
ncbi:MAG: hypothetical protein M3Y50_06315, partial [Acidobacteriota bacterium]|nr:hypothetical protein [Acidobacteriota bacterium]